MEGDRFTLGYFFPFALGTALHCIDCFDSAGCGQMEIDLIACCISDDDEL